MADDRHKIKKMCWANNTDCKGELTKEHVVSSSILSYLGPLNFDKQNKRYRLGKGSYVIKNLCEYHNRMLSKYDNEALRFFSGVHKLTSGLEEDYLEENEVGQKILRVDGRLLEKWFAKTMFNAMIFDTRVFKPENLPWFPSPAHIMPKLFNSEDFENPFGLYLGKLDNPINTGRMFPWQMIVHYKPIRCFHNQISKWETYNVPIFYYTRCMAIEVVGFFNLTRFDNKFMEENVMKGFIEILKERGIYHPVKWGFNMQGDEDKGKLGPARIVELEW